MEKPERILKQEAEWRGLCYFWDTWGSTVLALMHNNTYHTAWCVWFLEVPDICKHEVGRTPWLSPHRNPTSYLEDQEHLWKS